jgi:hypothetical protein
VAEKCGERHIHSESVNKGVVEFEDSQQDDSCCIPHHCFLVVVQLASHRQQRKIIGPGISKQLDCLSIYLQSQTFEEGNQCVDQLFIVEVVLKRDQGVQEGVRHNVV